MKIIPLPFRCSEPILACGADLKGAFAFAMGKEAFVEDGFGDLGEIDNFTRYEQAIRKRARSLKMRPKIIACDLHPVYFSTRFAEEYANELVGCKLVRLQHHEAHVASAILEHGINTRTIGVAFDGTGYGLDKTIWGGEFFVGDLRRLARAAHLKTLPMPGSDMAIREPWRMAASYLYSVYGNGFLKLKIGFVKKMNRKKWGILKSMIDKGINSPLTSSTGRLFDAVASLVLMKDRASHEAELPIALEKMAIELRRDEYPFDVGQKKEVFIIELSKTIKGIVKDLSEKADIATISSKFHNTIARMILETSLRLKKKFSSNSVVLSGGVFQNNFLHTRTVEMLQQHDFKVYTHVKVATNDSGVPIGQIALVHARCLCV